MGEHRSQVTSQSQIEEQAGQRGGIKSRDICGTGGAIIGGTIPPPFGAAVKGAGGAGGPMFFRVGTHCELVGNLAYIFRTKEITNQTRGCARGQRRWIFSLPSALDLLAACTILDQQRSTRC